MAGTYTPFALGPLAESGGYTLAVIEWVAAALGIAQLTGGIHYRRLSNLSVSGMGWLGIFLDTTFYRECQLARFSFRFSLVA